MKGYRSRVTGEDTRIDWGFRLIAGTLGGVACWLLAMPFVPAIALSTMNRFHLRTGSFWTWAAQAPIPSMYNFANTTEVRDLPPTEQLIGLVDPLLLSDSDEGEIPLGVIGGRTINHFPAREITFSDARRRYLRSDQPRWYVLKSSYRGLRLESVYEVKSTPDGAKSVQLLGSVP